MHNVTFYLFFLLLLQPAVALKCSITVCVHIWKLLCTNVHIWKLLCTNVHIWKLLCTIYLWGKGGRKLEPVQDTDNN